MEVVVAGARRVAPRDEAVAREHEPARRREALGAVARERAREREPGPHVVDVRDVAAEGLAHERLGPRRVRERLRREVVRVHDAAVGEQGVQRRLDGGRGLARVQHAGAHERHHLLVGHLVARLQEREVAEAQRREAGARDGREVGAAALDGQHLDLAPREVARAPLDRAVAAPGLRQRRVGAHGVRERDEAVQVVAARGRGEAVVHGHTLPGGVAGVDPAMSIRTRPQVYAELR